MAHEWKNIATLLNVPLCLVEVIEYDYKKANDCLREMLKKWLEQTNPEPSWESLAEAVEVLGNQAIAKQIREKCIAQLTSDVSY